jgi:predicted NBD/HSP70 family sugar kinase
MACRTASLSPFARRNILWCDDGTAATVADAWALGIPNLIHFSLGTGVGGGIYFDGRVLRDRELGHLLVHPDGLLCSCGRRGCLQAYASGRALEHFRQDGDVEAGTARWLAAASKALAACSSNLIELFGSTHVTLSGGMAPRFPSLPMAVESAMGSTYLKKSHRIPKVLLSPHGGEAPLQGALALSGATEDEQGAVCRRWTVN